MLPIEYVSGFFVMCLLRSAVLPDTTATDLDQHLGLVTTQNHTNHTQSGHASSLLVPRYPSGNHTGDFAISGPRSLSDNSSAAESPVQDDLLTGQTSLGTNHVGNNSNFSLMPTHQNSAVPTSSYASSNCNNSLYPVLPASLLYSQLYSAANQTHNFHSLHSHTTQAHHNADLQSVMDQLSTSNTRQMNGGSDLLLTNSVTSCAAAASRQDENAHARGLTNNGGQRGPAQNSDAVVWRPY